jgi:hypothetical protein
MKYSDGIAITTSDTTEYNPPLQAIFVGGAGSITIVTSGQHSVLLTTPIIGTVHRVPAARKVMATGTTATLMVGYR